jgi:hypothetical protein
VAGPVLVVGEPALLDDRVGEVGEDAPRGVVGRAAAPVGLPLVVEGRLARLAPQRPGVEPAHLARGRRRERDGTAEAGRDLPGLAPARVELGGRDPVRPDAERAGHVRGRVPEHLLPRPADRRQGGGEVVAPPVQRHLRQPVTAGLAHVAPHVVAVEVDAVGHAHDHVQRVDELADRQQHGVGWQPHEQAAELRVHTELVGGRRVGVGERSDLPQRPDAAVGRPDEVPDDRPGGRLHRPSPGAT